LTKNIHIDFLTTRTFIRWASVVWVLLTGVALTFSFYPIALLPAAFAIGYLLIYYPAKVLLFIGFVTPLSYQIEDAKGLGGVGISLPSELLLVALLGLYIIAWILGYREDRRMMRHPLTKVILLLLAWTAITAMASSLPLVSFKFFLSKLWFIVCMYFLINRFFNDPKYIRTFIVCFILGMSAATAYTVLNHASQNFSEQAGLSVMWPFFKDHTIYGALLALTFPLVILEFFHSGRFSFRRVCFGGLILLFTVALIYSYTRAAWVSLVGALGVWILMRLRIKFGVVLAGAAVALTGLFFLQDTIAHRLEKNRQDSSGDLAEHVQSISNVSSDASNLERLNRWNSALRMWEEQPFWGFGPGTYAFEYGTFQKSSDRTIISTNQGDAGNAHSEYLGPLAEQGVLGMVLVILLVGMAMYVGITLYFKLEKGSYLRDLTMAIILSLVTYFLHGVLNNYLDTDKASVPIWAMMSVLVAIDIYHRDTGNQRNLQQSKAVSSK